MGRSTLLLAALVGGLASPARLHIVWLLTQGESDVTGLADRELAAEAARRGAHDYLVKGRMTGDLLGRIVRYSIERHRLLAELRTLQARK